MVRVEQIMEILTLEHVFEHTLGVLPKASLRSRASLHTGASRYNAAPVLITAYITA